MAYECGSCDRLFWAGWKARDQHCVATGHDFPDFECDTCHYISTMNRAGAGTWTSGAIRTLLLSLAMPAIRSSQLRRRPNSTRQKFTTDAAHAIEASSIHLNSSVHRQTSVTCPFCKSQHGTATGLVHHLERGACPQAPLDRDSLYRAVRRYDPQGVVSKKLLEWNGSSSYSANDRAWNPYVEAYECYLCNRLFNTLNGLNQHLNSPLHQQALYHCPNPSCRRDFTTLAATINHLESESCGFMKFRAVQTNVERIVNPNRMLQF
ncbi:unnamed protein product [Clonostachys rosea]|uniref:C2H2-type domain-containing protein n=1 Tax=Bionectria ochroleuca TaxID=29856 RepID=A0ABY6UVE2_BIOOC|nr:unnamed protein product [Clonostachys rosea]